MTCLTIDNRKIEADAGAKILEAALENGIDITHMCYHPDLKPFGGCRLCLVEVEGEPHLVSSCVTPVAEGMQVHTANPRILRARKSIVQLLLLNHPMDCLVCERSGDCKLQKLAFDLNVQPGKYKMKKRVLKSTTHQAVMEIDPRKCMHCGLCVRVCKELQQTGAIDFYNRGFKTEVSIPFSDESNCEFCGQCIEVCPVAGVIGFGSKYVAKPWELTQTHTICPYCGTGCLITLNTKLNRLVKISSEDKSGVNEGSICATGRFGCEFISSEERLTTPLIKKDGQFQPVSWEEALTYTANKLKGIIDSYGSQAIGGLGSVKCANEDNYLFQKFMRAVIGTNNMDNYSRLEHSPSLCGLSQTLGLVTANNTLDRLSSSELIIVIGSNPSNSHPIVSLKIKKALKSGQSKLIVINPLKIKLASLADQWLSLKPSTDLVLLGGIMHILMNESHYKNDFPDIKGSEAFGQSLEEYHPDRVAARTGISKEELVQVAAMIAKAKSISIVYSSGITQHTNGTQNVIALADLFLLTGHAFNDQSGIYPLRDDSNSQGACDMGVLPDYLPGYQKFPLSQEKFEHAWKCKFPSTPGLTSTQMLEAIKDGKLKALYVMGDNPMRHYPNSHHIQEILNSLDLLIVQDLFLNQTAKLADVVFPAASFAEREGTVTNMERRVQNISRAIIPPEEVLPDWQIVSQLSTKLGYPMNYSSTAEIMNEINELVPIYGGITSQRLENGGLCWPCPDETHPGTTFLQPHLEDANLVPLPPIPEAKETDCKYSFKLIIGGTLFHSGSGTLSMRSKILQEICPSGYVSINDNDAVRLGISNDDMVRISSQNACVEAKARLVAQNPEGTVFMPIEFEELHAQELMPEQFDPISHIPAMKVCAVSLGKV